MRPGLPCGPGNFINTNYFSAMPHYSPVASTSHFTQPSTALQAYSHSMYQYTKSQIMVLINAIQTPNQTSTPQLLPQDQELNFGYGWECEE
ncbi:hypothetical protein BKA56DRAFT_350825 [Ilyonectria sp. MPI-CAGE-AT-0026]|nr:hypothetical protein BKA56DRAFT_350825 [Ilyonectria sp. MPI-CAGE-AT-0026]